MLTDALNMMIKNQERMKRKENNLILKLFLDMITSFSSGNVNARVAWLSSWLMKMREKPPPTQTFFGLVTQSSSPTNFC